jgi:hypothetical protein
MVAIPMAAALAWDDRSYCTGVSACAVARNAYGGDIYGFFCNTPFQAIPANTFGASCVLNRVAAVLVVCHTHYEITSRFQKLATSGTGFGNFWLFHARKMKWKEVCAPVERVSIPRPGLAGISIWKNMSPIGGFLLNRDSETSCIAAAGCSLPCSRPG